MNYINNCMNNVTIEDKEKNEENNSIYEDNKDSFLNMENNKNDENEKIFDKVQCSGIEEKIDKSSEDIQDININKNNVDEDLFNMMNSKDKENGGENEIEFEGEKCLFNGILDDNSSFLEKNEKLIEELKEEKSKNIMNKDFKEFEELKNKNSILQERIQTLLEEKKINNQLMEEKNKELEKANIKVKNMKDKIFDINEYIKTKCNNKIFINKITTICNLDNIK